ncbi:putative RNA-directed DNA polymerase [Tanacetum coccineum]
MVNSSHKYGLEKHFNYSDLSSCNHCFKQYLDYTDLPAGSKWIFKIKYKASGEVERYKARLVAKGFSQKGGGLDYEEIFSPVVKMTIVRCLISLVVCNGWSLFQHDVNNAFLYGDLAEDVHTSLPLGLSSKNENKVCKLNKSLYGLKQAPRQCNAKLSQALIKNGFKQSKYDFSLYTMSSNNVFVALLVYIDYIVITGNNVNEIEKFKSFLSRKFQIKDLGFLKYFLDIEVLENKSGVCMTQRKYCLELLHEYGLLAAKLVYSPLHANIMLNHKESESDKCVTNVTGYQKLVGKLIYLTHTRPNISYVVHCLSQFMLCPLKSHMSLPLRVLRYLKGSRGITRKSISGYCVFCRNSLVSWKSKKQSTLSRSSAEAEYRCMTSATCEMLIQCFMKKTKHFEIDVHLVREKVASGVIETVKISSHNQISDIFTKGLDIAQHKKLCKELLLVDMFQL